MSKTAAVATSVRYLSQCSDRELDRYVELVGKGITSERAIEILRAERVTESTKLETEAPIVVRPASTYQTPGESEFRVLKPRNTRA